MRKNLGIIGGTLIGLVVLFALQFAEVNLFLDFLLGMLVGLESGYWIANPQLMKEIHAKTFVGSSKFLKGFLKFFLKIPYKAIGSVLGQIVLYCGIFGLIFCSFFVLVGDPVIRGIWVLMYVVGSYTVINYWEKRSDISFLCTLFSEKIRNKFFRRALFAAAVPLFGVETVTFVAFAVILGIPLYFVCVLASLAVAAGKKELIAVTAGIVIGISIGFITAVIKGFSLPMEVLSVAIGIGGGLGVSALMIGIGKINFVHTFLDWWDNSFNLERESLEI